jgi:hypothetical protein
MRYDLQQLEPKQKIGLIVVMTEMKEVKGIDY